MKEPRLVISELAASDVLAQADWYHYQSDDKLATRWERAVTASVLRLVRMPRSGALCGFKTESLRDIRRLRITGFPSHLVFYKLIGSDIHILRVLHGARDLEKLFSE